MKERKEKIQKNFRERLGLVVDMPKVGFGNTNTGNLARRAFANAEQFSEITGVEEELIKDYFESYYIWISFEYF